MLLFDDIIKVRRILKEEMLKRKLEEYKRMYQEEEIRNDVPFDASKRHLCNVAERFKKYGNFSKDPKFKELCHRRRLKCFTLLSRLKSR